MSLSNKTTAELCRALAAAVNSHAELDLLFLENDIEGSRLGGGLQARSNALVMALRDRSDGDATLTSLAQYILERRGAGWTPSDRLIYALRIDGLDWQEGRLIPTTPQPATLSEELSRLERDLEDLGQEVSAEHYRQAWESFVASNWEAANGQTRSFMEGFLITLGVRNTSHTRSDASAALQDLRDNAFLDQAEWQMIKGFWNAIQERGPHHGLSHEQEALFRLHVATSIARYAIHRFNAGNQSA